MLGCKLGHSSIAIDFFFRLFASVAWMVLSISTEWDVHLRKFFRGSYLPIIQYVVTKKVNLIYVLFVSMEERYRWTEETTKTFFHLSFTVTDMCKNGFYSIFSKNPSVFITTNQSHAVVTIPFLKLSFVSFSFVSWFFFFLAF